ncbi:hypothetical protein [Hymenobacter terrenus]|uniref:hypothetical protein n=1 Tax=Hymenobacter terrenus TaxID=1629124 RepID=UPI000619BA37|nr:hypothetical protein [Hymenobacter terrenus]
MPAPDNLQITISDADLKQVNDALDTLEAVLGPVLITLSGKEIQRLPKASDGTLPFIQQALQFSEQQPQFAPAYLDLPGLRQDLKSWEQLTAVLRRLQPLTTNLNSTTILLGSESYVTALAYYNAVQQAAKRAISGAVDIFQVLKARFEQATSRKKAPKASE